MRLLLEKRIEDYLRRTGMRPTTFGRLALRDPLLIADLRRGRILRPLTQARIEAFLDRAEKALKGSLCRRRR